MPTQPTTVVNITRGEAFDTYIGRPGKGLSGPWGNPFVIGKDGTRDEVIAKYERWIQTQPDLLARLPELKGKRLGCFCAGPGCLTVRDKMICHGQILARLADALPDPPRDAPTILGVTFDGGSRGNPGQGYGSFAVLSPKRPQPHIERRAYPGVLTNNQAEYRTLIAALEYILDVITRTQREPGQFVLDIAGDSALVINQVQGTWKVKQPELRPLADRCRELLARFGSYRLTWQARAASVTLLGH